MWQHWKLNTWEVSSASKYFSIVQPSKKKYIFYENMSHGSKSMVSANVLLKWPCSSSLGSLAWAGIFTLCIQFWHYILQASTDKVTTCTLHSMQLMMMNDPIPQDRQRLACSNSVCCGQCNAVKVFTNSFKFWNWNVPVILRKM